jgi:hypothetical protein
MTMQQVKNINKTDKHIHSHKKRYLEVISRFTRFRKKIESTVVRLKRSYEDTGSVVCLATKGRQLERNFEELKPASHVPILGTILNIFDVLTMHQLKNINKTDKHIHSHKKKYLEVISRFTRFKEFNGEKKTATKTSNMFKIVPRIGTCDADFSSSKFARVVSLSLLSKPHFQYLRSSS